MANDKITMLKLKRMLQLLDAGKSMNEICRDLHMSKRTVHNYKQRVTSSSVPLAELRRLDDKQLNQLLQPQSPVPKPDERKEALDKELSNYLKEWNKPYVSILLLWEEYRKAYPAYSHDIDPHSYDVDPLEEGMAFKEQSLFACKQAVVQLYKDITFSFSWTLHRE